MPKIPHVALLIETSRAYGRGLLQGVIRFQREHGPWSIYFQPHGLGAPPPPWLKNWHGDGILARIDDRLMGTAVRRTGLLQAHRVLRRAAQTQHLDGCPL